MDHRQVPDEARAADVSRLVDAYGDRLLRFAFLYLKDLHLAEDAVQEAFLKAHHHWHSFRGDSSELTWLTAITLNCCRSLRRAAWFQQRARSVPLDQAPQMSVADEVWDDTVVRAVMQLPPKYKEIILLYYYQGLPLKDAALLLKTNGSTLSTRLKRARAMLKKELEGWYFDGE